jgi:hypothetical protein
MEATGVGRASSLIALSTKHLRGIACAASLAMLPHTLHAANDEATAELDQNASFADTIQYINSHIRIDKETKVATQQLQGCAGQGQTTDVWSVELEINKTNRSVIFLHTDHNVVRTCTVQGVTKPISAGGFGGSWQEQREYSAHWKDLYVNGDSGGVTLGCYKADPNPLVAIPSCIKVYGRNYSGGIRGGDSYFSSQFEGMKVRPPDAFLNVILAFKHAMRLAGVPCTFNRC